MKITTEITREDFLNFNKHVLLKTRFKRSFIIATVFIILWIIILNYNAPLNLITILTEIVVFYLAWGLLIFLIYQISFLRIKKMPDEDGTIIGVKTYILSEDGFKEITNSSETLTKWNGIKNIEETNDYFFVFVDKIAAYVIPKRSFSNKTETEQFLQIMKNKKIE
jgi:hypothetical protein